MTPDYIKNRDEAAEVHMEPYGILKTQLSFKQGQLSFKQGHDHGAFKCPEVLALVKVLEQSQTRICKRECIKASHSYYCGDISDALAAYEKARESVDD